MVASNRAKSSRFTVTLPWVAPSAAPVQNRPEAQPVDTEISVPDVTAPETSSPIVQELSSEAGEAGDDLPSILLVDDNMQLLEMMEKILATKYRVLTAENGLEALKQLKAHAVDLIVSDVMMPGMDGFALCRKLKSQLETSHIPVIMLTAKQSADDRVDCYEAGADGYLAKPFELKVLAARIDNLLRTYRNRQQAFRMEDHVRLAELEYSSGDTRFLQDMADCIHTHLAEEGFDLEQLSGHLNVSKSTLHRKVKAMTGLTPLEFIRNIKLKYACEMLSRRDRNIAEIAYATGFSSPKYFTKCFKEEFGLTPREYQEKEKNKTVTGRDQSQKRGKKTVRIGFYPFLAVFYPSVSFFSYSFVSKSIKTHKNTDSNENELTYTSEYPVEVDGRPLFRIRNRKRPSGCRPLLPCRRVLAIPNGARSNREVNFNEKLEFLFRRYRRSLTSDFADNHWRTLTCPHDWSIEGRPEEANPAGNDGGYYPTGIGWYRKTFDFVPDSRRPETTLYFEGVYMNAEVFVNGHNLGIRPLRLFVFLPRHHALPQSGQECHCRACGQLGTEELPLVHRFRHLPQRETYPTPKAHFEPWGIGITTKQVNRKTQVEVEATLANRDKDLPATLLCTVTDLDGHTILTQKETVTLEANRTSKVKLQFPLKTPSSGVLKHRTSTGWYVASYRPTENRPTRSPLRSGCAIWNTVPKKASS